MAFILRRERESSEISKIFSNYKSYLREKEEYFPKGVFSIATSDFWYNAHDYRSPHDGCLETFQFCTDCSVRQANRFEMKLINAFQDHSISIGYSGIRRLEIDVDFVPKDFEWLYDEFRLEDGFVVHEIEWVNGRRWKILLSDLVVKYNPT